MQKSVVPPERSVRYFRKSPGIIHQSPQAVAGLYIMVHSVHILTGTSLIASLMSLGRAPTGPSAVSLSSLSASMPDTAGLLLLATVDEFPLLGFSYTDSIVCTHIIQIQKLRRLSIGTARKL